MLFPKNPKDALDVVITHAEHVINVNVEKEKEEPVINFLEILEDDDDVQNVFSNVNFGNN